MTEEEEISRRSQEASSKLQPAAAEQKNYFFEGSKNQTESTRTVWNDVVSCPQLLLILDFLVNVRKVTSTCYFPTGHHIQSVYFPKIEVNSPGKHCTSVIIETDLEFTRQIIIIILPPIFPCIFNLMAAAHGGWQAFPKRAVLHPQICSFPWGDYLASWLLVWKESQNCKKQKPRQTIRNAEKRRHLVFKRGSHRKGFGSLAECLWQSSWTYAAMV